MFEAEFMHYLVGRSVPRVPWLCDDQIEVLNGVPRCSNRADVIHIATVNELPMMIINNKKVIISWFLICSFICCMAQVRKIDGDGNYLYTQTLNPVSISHESVGTMLNGQSFHGNLLNQWQKVSGQNNQWVCQEQTIRLDMQLALLTHRLTNRYWPEHGLPSAPQGNSSRPRRSCLCMDRSQVTVTVIHIGIIHQSEVPAGFCSF